MNIQDHGQHEILNILNHICGKVIPEFLTTKLLGTWQPHSGMDQLKKVDTFEKKSRLVTTKKLIFSVSLSCFFFLTGSDNSLWYH